VTQEVQRNYLEIKSIQDLNEVIEPNGDYSLKLLESINFQLNKFFYKNIGKKHKWIDRLVWTDAQWIDYVSNKNVKTYVFKFKDDLAGFFELISHNEKKEIEIAYFGLLEEFQNKKLGSYLLSQAIQKSFNESLNKSINRVWVHTCSLDHKNALSNYIARGMKIFKSETIKI
jgi:GNAT superfamily N-acetyltransferase